MRLIDADVLMRCLTTIDRLARSDAQAALLGRVYHIVSKQPIVSEIHSQQWISIKDRLPNEREDVLLMFPKNMAVGFLNDGWFVNSGCNWYTAVDTDDGDEEPIYWMPLPDPQKEDE